MNKQIVDVENMEIPKGLQQNVLEYLANLISKTNALRIKNGSLRGRQYSNSSVLDAEKNITTPEIRELIKKKYLTKAYNSEEYSFLIPNILISEHIKNINNKNKAFKVINVHKKEVIFGHLRAVKAGERSELMRKGKKLDYICHPKAFMRAAFVNGFNYTDIFYIPNEGKPVYAILGLKDNNLYQVYPSEMNTDNKKTELDSENKEGVTNKTKSNQIPIEFKITEDSISIMSDETATSYINFRKQTYPTYTDVSENYKTAKEYLLSFGIKTIGIKELDAFFKQQQHKETYDEFLKAYDLLFKELHDASVKLVSKGIVSGGLNKNPEYKVAWDIVNKLRVLTRKPEVRSILDKNRKFNTVIDLHGNEELNNYRLFAF